MNIKEQFPATRGIVRISENGKNDSTNQNWAANGCQNECHSELMTSKARTKSSRTQKTHPKFLSIRVP